MFWDVLANFVTVMGDLKEGSSQAKAAAFNSNISRTNASTTATAGAMEESRVRREARRRIGQIQANVGTSGFMMDGSAEDLLADSMFEAELDAQTTRYNYKAAAKGYEMQAQLYDQQGGDAKTASYINAASSLLKGAQPYIDKYTNPKFSLGGGSGNISVYKSGEVIRWNS